MFFFRNMFHPLPDSYRELKSDQGSQDSSGNQKNVIQGQRQDMENRHTQQRT